MKALFLALLISTTAFAFGTTADPVKASINDEMQIKLPADIALQSVYILDISSLEFNDESQAKQFFGMFTENVVHYAVNYDAMEVEIHLHSYADPEWNLDQWNTYFSNRSAKMQAVYSSL